MYPGLQAKIRPHQPAFIMATSGETVTYAELQARSNLAPPGGARRARWDLHIGSGHLREGPGFEPSVPL
jgi:hypothetical protein